MHEVKGGAIALAASSVVIFCVMLVHPSHIDPRPVLGPFDFSEIVHGFAILSHVLFLYGAFALSRFQGLDRATAGLALAFAGIATVTMVIAGAISMFVTPAGAALAHSIADPAAQDVALRGVRTWVAANRGFAQIHVALASVAIGLWALGTRGILRIAGLAVGLGILAWQLTGSFEPSVHTMPIVTGVQGLWLIAMSAVLFRSTDLHEETAI